MFLYSYNMKNTKKKFELKYLILSALFAALTVICSQISIPMPFSPVPFSLGIVAIFLTGQLLPKKYSLISVLIYLLMGIAGLPVFSNFSGGAGMLLGPTGGFLMGYPLAAFFISALLEKTEKGNFWIVTLITIASIFIIYIPGSALLGRYMGISFPEAFAIGALPFLIPDIIKAALSSLLTKLIHKKI